MQPVSETPTDPSDYAVLTCTYASLLGALALASRGRTPIDRADLVPLAAATFAVAKLVGKEKVETWVREPFVEERPDGRRPRGTGLRYAVGELLSCTRCLGAWGALGLVGLRIASPDAGRAVTTVLATSAGNDFLQTSFSWLCAKADAQSSRARSGS